MVFINKMDRENADPERALKELGEKFQARFVPLDLPVGAEQDFRGVVDLIPLQALLSPEGRAEEIPQALRAEAAALRQSLVEVAAESDDELIMKYLEGEELTQEEIRRGLKSAILARKAVPVFFGSALLSLGIQPLLDALVEFLPSPAEAAPISGTNPATGEALSLEALPFGPLSVLVFKTLADPFVGKLTYFRVYSGTLESDSRAFNPRSQTEERIGQLYFPKGKEQIPAESIIAGDIGTVAKLQGTITGDTLCDRGEPVLLPPIVFPQPLYSSAIYPKTKADQDRLGSVLPRLMEEDPTVRVYRDSDTGEAILSGMGESHIDIAARRLREKFNVEVEAHLPRIPYKETITKEASAQGRYKRQTGGRGQFGDVWIRLEPLPRGQGVEFADEITGGAIPKNFIPSVEKGLRESCKTGILAGYPTIDFRAALYDGSYHSVDSSDLAFTIAGSLGFKNAAERAGVILLEPIWKLTITVPESYMGDILGDLNGRRAQVLGMDQERGNSIITALAPLAEVQRYATDLRAMTQGRGRFTMEFAHYEKIPDHLAEGIIAKAREKKEQERA